MTPLGLRLLATSLAACALSCAATPEPETPEELLFTVPSWCAWGYTPPPRKAQAEPQRSPSRLRPAKPRSDWARWAQARRASSDGPALCGVRVPIRAASDQADEAAPAEAGVCLEMHGTQIERATLLDDQGTAVAAELEPPQPGSSWRSFVLRSAEQKRLYVRLNGRALEAYLQGSGEQASGPCFYGEK